MRGRAVAVMALLIAARPTAAADPTPPEPLPAHNLAITRPLLACTLAQPTICRELLPGRYLDEERWTALDAELRRLQGQETRLGAENASLRTSLAGWQPGWRTLALALASGLAGGAYLAHKVAH